LYIQKANADRIPIVLRIIPIIAIALRDDFMLKIPVIRPIIPSIMPKIGIVEAGMLSIDKTREATAFPFLSTTGAA